MSDNSGDTDVSMMDMGIEYGNDIGSDPFDDVIEEGDFSEEQLDAGEELDESESGEEEQSDEEGSIEDLEETKEPKEESEDSEQSKEQDSEEVEEAPVEERLDAINKQLEDGSLEVKIDENTSATLQELKNDFIGQKEISRRFSDLDVKNKQLEADTNEINGYINEFAGKLRDGDSVGAMAYFGEFAGVPPYMVKEQLIAALRPEIIRREQMTAVEVQNEYLNSQNDYLQQQRESDSQQRAAEQANMELKTHEASIRETHNIDEETWNATYEGIKETLKEGEELTPELVADTVKYGRMYQQAESVVTNFEGQLENADEWVEELVNVKEKHPEFTDEDLQEVLKTAYETYRKSSTEQKLANKVSAKKAPTKQQTKTKSQPQDDIDPELEDWL